MEPGWRLEDNDSRQSDWTKFAILVYTVGRRASEESFAGLINEPPYTGSANVWGSVSIFPSHFSRNSFRKSRHWSSKRKSGVRLFLPLRLHLRKLRCWKMRLPAKSCWHMTPGRGWMAWLGIA